MHKDKQNEDKSFANRWINLAEERLGAKVIAVTDDFFAEKENLIRPGRGVFIEDKYTENGKWMDGWESRRKRTPGHDFAIIKLGLRGIVQGVDIDTNHFTGNHPEFSSLEACCIDGEPNDSTKWELILDKVKMNPGSQHLFEIDSQKEWTHIKLNIFPDGGVARLRIYGDVKKDWNRVLPGEIIDLAHVSNEGKAISCSDMYFSSKDNINAPGRGVNMGDGWESKRRRGPGHDWLILQLGKRAQVKEIEIDTCHFKGNYPDRAMIEAIDLKETQNLEDAHWLTLLPEVKLYAHKQHYYKKELLPMDGVTHIRLNIYPDGGVSRLRVLGVVDES